MNQDELNIACIRSTVIDVINKAKSGHPGMALGSAPILYTLFKNHLVSDPNHPEWINRYLPTPRLYLPVGVPLYSLSDSESVP